MRIIQLSKSVVTLPFRGLKMAGKFLLENHALKTLSGAKLAKKREYKRYLNESNKGLLLDGQSLCLSERESFQNVCLIARVGAGKTSQYIIPNVLDKARRKCSLVVNDPKGEVFEATSQYMSDKGYNVIVIDPENLNRSSRFNPLMEVTDNIQLEQIAQILIMAGSTSANKDQFWNHGAMRFVSLFLKCLLNAADENDGYFTLANLYYLFQNFGEDGKALDEFMVRYTANPNHLKDDTLWNEWQGVLTGNDEGIRSFILSAITALRALSNPNVARLTATSSFKLGDLRQRKTIIYFITPAQHAEYYSFLTSIFFQSVFNMAMRELPGRRDLPIYVLYDEFGHSAIPNFVSTANTIRGYKVSLSIVLQAIGQLNARYGRDYAQAIQGGFNTWMALSGSDPDTAKFFEGIIGRVRERTRKTWDDHQQKYTEYNLLNANEIRTIGGNQALIVSSNRNPVLLNVLPHFGNLKLKGALRRGAYELPAQQGNDELAWVPLRF